MTKTKHSKDKFTKLEISLILITATTIICLIIAFMVLPKIQEHKVKVINAKLECSDREMYYVDYECETVCNQNTTNVCFNYIKRCYAICGYEFN